MGEKYNLRGYQRDREGRTAARFDGFVVRACKESWDNIPVSRMYAHS